MNVKSLSLVTGIAAATFLTACGGSSSSGSNNNSGGDNNTGGGSALATAFPKSTSVFDIPILATSGTPDDKIIHAANILAEYLDNNEDGTPDNQAVVDQMRAAGATLVMAASEDEFERAAGNVEQTDAFQDLYASEVVVGNIENAAAGQFDASLEEVLHLITHVGYAGVYPGIFGETKGSSLADAMDIARGGQFDTIPNPYPAGAWYTYDDQTCNYSCMATEYFYWALTSILGAQDGAGRFDQIRQEWQLNTRQLVEDRDVRAFALMTDPQYGLPSVLPDGNYQPQDFEVTATAAAGE